MQKVSYQTFPAPSANLPAEAVDLFNRLRKDMGELLNKISLDAQTKPEIDLNGAIEEAYLRALVVAGVLTPLPADAALLAQSSTLVH